MFKGFRDFILRGDVVELAVAVVVAGAFGAVIASFVADILTPLLGLIGVPDFSGLSFLVAAAIYLVIITPKIGFDARMAREEEAATKTCPHCATDILIAATRCPHCTSQLD